MGVLAVIFLILIATIVIAFIVGFVIVEYIKPKEAEKPKDILSVLNDAYLSEYLKWESKDEIEISISFNTYTFNTTSEVLACSPKGVVYLDISKEKSVIDTPFTFDSINEYYNKNSKENNRMWLSKVPEAKQITFTNKSLQKRLNKQKIEEITEGYQMWSEINKNV